MPHIQYFDRTGRPLSKREACEADGKTLRDGISMRIPAHLADHAPRFADARAFWDANNLRVTDARAIGGVEGCKPGFRVSDSPINRQAIADAYADFEWYLNNAYRDAAPAGSYPFRQSSEGSPCSVDGRPGTLVKVGNSLVCRPTGSDARTLDARTCPTCEGTGEDDDGDDCETCGGSGRVANGDNGETATSDRRTVDQIAHDHSVAMERVYAARNRETSEAWREGKDNK
jgi:hypothetical protein